MRRIAAAGILAIVLALGGITVSAESHPALSGTAGGIELCPEFICGFALFVGQFQGEVNSKNASGGFVATVQHNDLAPVGENAAITGGQWTITAGNKSFSGDVASGNILTLPGGTQFCVTMTLEINSGGNGEVYFTGLLDHGPFPPTIGGFVTQSPLPCSVLIP
jgi:hypothetical protein